MARIFGIFCVAAFWVAVLIVSPLSFLVLCAAAAISIAFIYAVGLVVTGEWDCWRMFL